MGTDTTTRRLSEKWGGIDTNTLKHTDKGTDDHAPPPPPPTPSQSQRNVHDGKKNGKKCPQQVDVSVVHLTDTDTDTHTHAETHT